jgi:hypothetical protein
MHALTLQKYDILLHVGDWMLAGIMAGGTTCKSVYVASGHHWCLLSLSVQVLHAVHTQAHDLAGCEALKH